MTWIWIRIHFFQCGSRIRIKIKWILSTDYQKAFELSLLNIKFMHFKRKIVTETSHPPLNP